MKHDTGTAAARHRGIGSSGRSGSVRNLAIKLRALVDADDCFGFIRRAVENGHEVYYVVDRIEEADGIEFLCPECFRKNGCQRPRVHAFICWRPHVPQEVLPNPGRWEFAGTGIDDLTLVASSSSVRATDGCRAHFVIVGGAIQFCEDSGKG